MWKIIEYTSLIVLVWVLLCVVFAPLIGKIISAIDEDNGR
jgi:hypothetical protein